MASVIAAPGNARVGTDPARTTPRQLLLVRHCQAAGQRSNAPLTDEGWRQARELADFLSDRPIDCIVASAFTRAQQSIAPLAANRGLTVRIDPRLNERLLSPTPIPNWRDIVRDSFTDWDRRAPGGESAREVLARGWAALNDRLNSGHHLSVVVSHGNLLGLILHSVDTDFGYNDWQRLTNPDLYDLRRDLAGRFRWQRLWR